MVELCSWRGVEGRGRGRCNSWRILFWSTGQEDLTVKDFWLIVPLSLSCPCREWSNLGNIWMSLLSSFCSSQTTCATVPRRYQLPVGHSCPSIQVDGWLWLVKSVALSPGLWRVAGIWAGSRRVHPSHEVSLNWSKEDWDRYYVDVLLSTSSETRLARGVWQMESDNRHQDCPLYWCCWFCSPLKTAIRKP